MNERYNEATRNHLEALQRIRSEIECLHANSLINSRGVTLMVRAVNEEIKRLFDQIKEVA